MVFSSAVDALLKTWTAPEPAARFAERVVKHAYSEEAAANRPSEATPPTRVIPSQKAAPRGVRGPILAGYRTALAYAAAAAILIAIGMRISGSTADENVNDPSNGSRMMTIAKEQIEQERELRLQQVRFEQFPASIGSFNPAPAVVDRVQRPTGNGFHSALRRAAVRANGIDNGWLAADRP